MQASPGREKRQTLEHPNVEISKVLILQNFPTQRVRQVSFHQFAAATIFLVGQTYATPGQETGAFLWWLVIGAAALQAKDRKEIGYPRPSSHGSTNPRAKNNFFSFAEARAWNVKCIKTSNLWTDMICTVYQREVSTKSVRSIEDIFGALCSGTISYPNDSLSLSPWKARPAPWKQNQMDNVRLSCEPLWGGRIGCSDDKTKYIRQQQD